MKYTNYYKQFKFIIAFSDLKSFILSFKESPYTYAYAYSYAYAYTYSYAYSHSHQHYYSHSHCYSHSHLLSCYKNTLQAYLSNLIWSKPSLVPCNTTQMLMTMAIAMTLLRNPKKCPYPYPCNTPPYSKDDSIHIIQYASMPCSIQCALFLQKYLFKYNCHYVERQERDCFIQYLCQGRCKYFPVLFIANSVYSGELVDKLKSVNSDIRILWLSAQEVIEKSNSIYLFIEEWSIGTPQVVSFCNLHPIQNHVSSAVHQKPLPANIHIHVRIHIKYYTMPYNISCHSFPSLFQIKVLIL